MKERINLAKLNSKIGITVDQMREVGEAATQLGISFMDTRMALATLSSAKYIYDSILVDIKRQTTALLMYPYVSRGWDLIRIRTANNFTICEFRLQIKK